MGRPSGKGSIVAVLAALALLAAPMPALATFAVKITDPGGGTSQVDDGGAGDLNPLGNAITVLSILSGTLVTFDVALSNSPGGPPYSFLQLNWLVTGTWSGDPSASVIVAASAQDYTFPATGKAGFLTSRAEVDATSTGSAVAQQWVDLGNGLFATTGPLHSPGAQGPLTAGSVNTASTSFTSLTPYSITDQVILTLGSGAILTSGTLTSTVVPEPITMFLGGTGLLMLGYAGRKRLLGR